MARKKQKQEHAPVQGTLFGGCAEDAYGGLGEATPSGQAAAAQPVVGQQPENGGLTPPAPPALEPSGQELPAWDEGLVPPDPGLLAELHAAHPGVLLLFRHRYGCCFHGDDGAVAFALLGCCGFGHGGFDDAVRKLLRAGHQVAVVETGAGLPRPIVPPVVTPVTAPPAEKKPGRKGKGAGGAG